jgi:hypothetical protein
MVIVEKPPDVNPSVGEKDKKDLWEELIEEEHGEELIGEEVDHKELVGEEVGREELVGKEPGREELVREERGHRRVFGSCL